MSLVCTHHLHYHYHYHHHHFFHISLVSTQRCVIPYQQGFGKVPLIQPIQPALHDTTAASPMSVRGVSPRPHRLLGRRFVRPILEEAMKLNCSCTSACQIDVVASLPALIDMAQKRLPRVRKHSIFRTISLGII